MRMRRNTLVLICISLLITLRNVASPQTTIATTPPQSPPTRVKTCNSCELDQEGQVCRAYNITKDRGWCKCDHNCRAYNDCCGMPSNQRTNTCSPNSNLEGLKFSCRSIYVDSGMEVMENEAFWMVSSCPDNWLEDIGNTERGNVVLSMCLTNNRDLPPVSDIVTGIVYKNEYCAACNLVQNPIVVWQPRLGCTGEVYEMLGSHPTAAIIANILKSDPDIFQQQCRPCFYQQPAAIYPPRVCFPVISVCLNKSDLERVTRSRLTTDAYKSMSDQCTNGPYDPYGSLNKSKFLQGSPQTTVTGPFYKNFACAMCNNADQVVCLSDRINMSRSTVPDECMLRATTNPITATIQTPITSAGEEGPALGPLPPGGGRGIPFTISLSNLGGGQVLVQIETEEVNITVECPEGQAPLGLECQDTLCPDGYTSTGGRCYFQFGDADKHSNSTTSSNESGSGFFLDCSTELILLNNSDLTWLTNSTILVDGAVFQVLGYSADGQPLVCPNNITTIKKVKEFFVYPPGYLELTYIGCSLSAIGCALMLVTYGLFKELRTLPSKALMNLALAILVTNLLFLIGGPITQAFLDAGLCTAQAIYLHFFFLVQFVWMCLLSFEMVRKFYQAKRMVLDTKKTKRQLLIVYTLVGWGLPLALVTTTTIVNFTANNAVLYGVNEDGSLGSCWINDSISAIVSFLVPLIITVCFTLVMFAIATLHIIQASRAEKKFSRESSDNIPFLRLNIAIFSTTALLWVFGFIALLIGRSWAWYPFIILNSSQGFFICIAFIASRKTLKLYFDLLSRWKGKTVVGFSSGSSISFQTTAVALDQTKSDYSLKITTFPQ